MLILVAFNLLLYRRLKRPFNSLLQSKTVSTLERKRKLLPPKEILANDKVKYKFEFFDTDIKYALEKIVDRTSDPICVKCRLVMKHSCEIGNPFWECKKCGLRITPSEEEFLRHTAAAKLIEKYKARKLITKIIMFMQSQ